jgi:hypothetical protein
MAILTMQYTYSASSFGDEKLFVSFVARDVCELQ